MMSGPGHRRYSHQLEQLAEALLAERDNKEAE
jgi:hypothetical protein